MDREEWKRVALSLLVWVLVSVLVLRALASLTEERLFVVSLIGYVVSVYVQVPPTNRPKLQSPVWWPIYGGLVLFTYLVIHRLVTFVPPDAW